VAYLLSNFVLDSSTFGDNNLIDQTIKDSKTDIAILIDVISTPIVASACPNMFAIFIEVTLAILGLKKDNVMQGFLQSITNFIKQ
jgi:hypothetical protein